MTAIAVAAAPLAELPAAALQTAAAFCCCDSGFDVVSIRPGDEGQVVVTGASATHGVEVIAPGTATAPLLLPIRPVCVALRRLPAEHCSVVAGDDELLTLRLYARDSTLAVSMPAGRGDGHQLPAVALSGHVEALQLDGAVLAKAAGQLRWLGRLSVTLFPSGWVFTGEADGMQVRALVCGCRRAVTQ